MARLAQETNADGSTITIHPRQNYFKQGNLGAVNAEIIVACDGCSTVSIDLRSTFAATLEVSGTIDGVNWFLIPVRPVTGGIYVTSLTSTIGGWMASCMGFDSVRVRMTAWTSGSAVTTIVASNAPFSDALIGETSTIGSTNTSSAGAAVTLTLASPGVGLRHYITSLEITRFAAALLTAGATPVLVTTTNLPGNLVFSLNADAAAQGTSQQYIREFTRPLAGVAQNSTTTIVCPVTTGVIWRVNANGYVAP